MHIRASRSSGPGGQYPEVTAVRIEASIELRALENLGDAQRARLEACFGARASAIGQDTRSQARDR